MLQGELRSQTMVGFGLSTPTVRSEFAANLHLVSPPDRMSENANPWMDGELLVQDNPVGRCEFSRQSDEKQASGCAHPSSTAASITVTPRTTHQMATVAGSIEPTGNGASASLRDKTKRKTQGLQRGTKGTYVRAPLGRLA